jgi:hypothetical protein
LVNFFFNNTALVSFDKKDSYVKVPSLFLEACIIATFSNLELKQNRVPSYENRVLVVWWRISQDQSENPEMEGMFFSPL